MKLCTRTLSAALAFAALMTAGLSFWAGAQLSSAHKASGASREATFKSYRIAQSLKSSIAGYELTMNEFYSTVLAFPAYQKKATTHKANIEQELAALATMQEGQAATATELSKIHGEMDSYRLSLESAMTSEDKDWDRAREALFKMNVLSTRAIHQADLLGQSAGDRATALDMTWQAHQMQAFLLLRIAATLALLIGIALLVSLLRAGKQPGQSAEDVPTLMH